MAKKRIARTCPDCGIAFTISFTVKELPSVCPFCGEDLEYKDHPEDEYDEFDDSDDDEQEDEGY